MTACATIEKRDPAVTRAEPARCDPVYRPNVDILENREELLLIADVPGATSDNIDVQYEDGELEVRAKIAPLRANHEKRTLLREYGVGDFYRVFELGEGIDNAKIHAEVRNGVLTVHLPKSEATKPRRIEVKTA